MFKHKQNIHKKNWKPLTELDLPGAVSESPINIYEDENIDSINSNNKYGYKNPTAERYTPRMVMAKVPYETTKECSWCPFKRLIVQVQWNLEQAYYSNPESDKGNVQRKKPRWTPLFLSRNCLLVMMEVNSKQWSLRRPCFPVLPLA